MVELLVKKKKNHMSYSRIEKNPWHDPDGNPRPLDQESIALLTEPPLTADPRKGLRPSAAVNPMVQDSSSVRRALDSQALESDFSPPSLPKIQGGGKI